MLDILINSDCENNNEWKTVCRESKKTHDMIFSFDEDMVSEVQTPVKQKKHSPRVHYEQKRKSYGRRRTQAQSVPDRAPVQVPAKRRNRSSSTKASVQHPSYALLERFSVSRYEVYRSKCLNDHERCQVGESKEMNTLYRFWSHYLRTNFDESMYEEFKCFAVEDAKKQAYYGMECLFRLFSYGLEKSLNLDMLNDFQAFVVEDLANKRCYGLEKFWAFLKYRTYQTPIDIVPEISSFLAKVYSLDDFPCLEAQLQGRTTMPIKKTSPRRRSNGTWVRKL